MIAYLALAGSPDPAVGPWTFVLLAIISATGGSIATGMFMRPKVNSDVRTNNVTAEVSLSADSREWVTQAMDRAQRAEARLDGANKRIDALEEEGDELRLKFNLLIDYVMLLHSRWGLDNSPPPPPKTLRLTPHHRPVDPEQPADTDGGNHEPR